MLLPVVFVLREQDTQLVMIVMIVDSYDYSWFGNLCCLKHVFIALTHSF